MAEMVLAKVDRDGTKYFQPKDSAGGNNLPAVKETTEMTECDKCEQCGCMPCEACRIGQHCVDCEKEYERKHKKDSNEIKIFNPFLCNVNIR
jgi:hypothetical protein